MFQLMECLVRASSPFLPLPSRCVCVQSLGRYGRYNKVFLAGFSQSV